jgi:hypothetical protein
MSKLQSQMNEAKAEAEAEAAINKIGADLAGQITKSAATHKVDVKVLHGKFFALTVDDDGKLSVAVAAKATKSRTGNGAGTNGNGGEYDYYLKDGRGPYESIQKAMDAMGVKPEQRPSHNRYDRLSASWKEKITRKPKAQAAEPKPEAAEPKAEAEPPAEDAPAAEKAAS